MKEKIMRLYITSTSVVATAKEQIVLNWDMERFEKVYFA